MAANARYRTLFKVQPFSQDAASLETVFELSDYDQSVPGVFVPVVTFFALQSSTTIAKAQIAANLKTGLEHTLTAIPVFSGTLRCDTSSGTFHVSRSDDEARTFVVYDIELDDPQFPSLERWSRAGFPVQDILARGAQLFPPGAELGPPPMYQRLEDGCPMFTAQLNFIPGGAILSAAFHHLQGDATSTDMFLQCWAENSRAVSEGKTTFSTFKPSFERKWFNVSKVPDAEEIQDLKGIVHGYKFADITAQADDTVMQDPTISTVSMPIITTRMYHLPASKSRALKESCKPLGPGQYVSTYDCVIALVWRALTRARLANHPEWDLNTQTTQFQHAVNMRGRFETVPKSYIGNGVALVIIGPLVVASLLDSKDGLRRAASACRRSINDVDEDWIVRTANLMAGVKGREKMEMDLDFMFGADVCSSSWTKNKAYEAHDFGFGLPLAFRIAFPAMDGVVVLCPGNPNIDADIGLTLDLALEASCQERVLQDAEFMKFFEVRGNENIA